MSGDVALGPWIYKTRAAIGRALHGVSGTWLLERDSRSANAKTAADDSQKVTLKEPDRHARALLEHNFGRENVVKLKSINWEDVGAKVYGQMWQAVAKQYAKWLGSLTADQIPANTDWFLKRGAELCKDHPDASAEQQISLAGHVLTCAVSAAMVRAGWTIETAPGRPIVLTRGNARFEPGAVMDLAEGKRSVDAWRSQCANLGIACAALPDHSDESGRKASSETKSVR